jgi:hypothetical protein
LLLALSALAKAFFLPLKQTSLLIGSLSGTYRKSAYIPNVVIVSYWLPRIERVKWFICYYSADVLIPLFGHLRRTHPSKNLQFLPVRFHLKMQVSKNVYVTLDSSI